MKRHISQEGHTTPNPAVEGPRFPCELCAKIFDEKNKLDHHILYHEKKSHPCIECSMTFIKKTELKRHILQEGHTAPNPALQLPTMSCDLCGKQFLGIHKLNRHMSSHERNSEPCTECDMQFLTKFELLKHKTITHE